jgi:hypothetical protein
MAIFGSNTNMPTYVNVSGTWQELTGTDQPYVKVSGTWQGVKNIYARASGVWQTVYEYDITGPIVPIPTSSPGGTADTVSWAAITDAGSGVASATLYQYFYNVTLNSYTAGNTYSIPTPTSSGSTSMAISSGFRNTPTGNHYQVYYYIVATDNAGNSTTGTASTWINTRPLGTYNFFATAADSRNLANSAWLGTTTEGIVGYSTSSRAYGCWFYGADTIKTACRGWNADTGTIFVKRAASTDTNRGNTGTFYLKTHNLSSASGAATFSGNALTTYLSGNSASAYVSLDYTAINALQDGTAQGIGMYFHDTQPGFLLGNRDFSGLITLVYN